MNRVEPIPWRGVRAPAKLILIALPLMAAAVLALPFLDQVYLRRLARLPGARPLVVWLTNGYNAWFVAGGLLLLLVVFAVFWVRRRLVGNKRLWVSAGCPNCMERELVRVSRKPADRFYGLAAIPAYRYACRNCTWRGLRIARREYSSERELELEQALVRFQVDGAPIPSNGAEHEALAETLVLAPAAPGSLFRDAGDVSWTDDMPPAMPLIGNEQADEEPNHQAEAKQADEAELLWLRSSEI